jgi:hypothetical protein
VRGRSLRRESDRPSVLSALTTATEPRCPACVHREAGERGLIVARRDPWSAATRVDHLRVRTRRWPPPGGGARIRLRVRWRDGLRGGAEEVRTPSTSPRTSAHSSAQLSARGEWHQSVGRVPISGRDLPRWLEGVHGGGAVFLTSPGWRPLGPRCVVVYGSAAPPVSPREAMRLSARRLKPFPGLDRHDLDARALYRGQSCLPVLGAGLVVGDAGCARYAVGGRSSGFRSSSS